MNKKAKASIIILGILFIPFFIYKYIHLSEYHLLPGKVVGFEDVSSEDRSLKGVTYYNRTVPVIQYRWENENVAFTEGKHVALSFSLNDKVTVLQAKNDPYKITVLSFWLYWLKFPELIILVLLFGIVYGTWYVYAYKKS